MTSIKNTNGNSAEITMRELTREDIGHIADYWLRSEKEFLIGMGVDLNKLPGRDELTSMLQTQIQLPDARKSSLALIAEVAGKPTGHCNVNGIAYGKEATMHLHLWEAKNRKAGLGTKMVMLSLPVFFDRLQLKTIWCEPYAANPAPIRTLEKVGFEFVKKYVTTPGSLNFEQEVNRYRMTRSSYDRIRSSFLNFN